MKSRMDGLVRSLNLAPRGLFFEIYELLLTLPQPSINCEEQDLAKRFNVKFPQFSKSLHVLLRKRLIIKTNEGLTCPYLEKERRRDEIRKAFSKAK